MIISPNRRVIRSLSDLRNSSAQMFCLVSGLTHSLQIPKFGPRLVLLVGIVVTGTSQALFG